MNKFIAKHNDTSLNIQIINHDLIKVNETYKKVELHQLDKNKFLLKTDNKFYSAFLISNDGNELDVVINNTQVRIEVLSELQAKALQLIENTGRAEHHQTEIKSPMPGMVLKVYKKSGDKIHRGETVMVLEAMKMENEIKSPKDGIVSEISVEQGKPVEKNVILFSIK